MHRLRYIFIYMLLLISTFSYSQTLIGTRSNYSGSNSLSLNPALISTSYLYADFSLFNFGIMAFNDFAYINGSDFRDFLFKKDHIFPTYEVNGYRTNFLLYDNIDKKTNNIYESLDLNLLSLMFSINENQAVGFSFNTRVYTSGTNIPWEIPELCVFRTKDNPEYRGHYQSSEMRTASLEWMEVALSYSRKIHERYLNRVDAGITAKYLIGYSAAVGNINKLDYEILENSVDDYDSIVVNKINADIAYSLPINYGESFTSQGVFDNSMVRGNGVAFDLGFTYTRKKEVTIRNMRRVSGCMCPKTDYLWKAGVSFMDVGFINFKKNALDNSIVNDGGSVFDISSFDHVDSFNDMIEIMSITYYGDPDASVVGNSFRIGLPTTIRFHFDYNFRKNIYVNATFIQPIRLMEYSVEAAPHIILEPRFESALCDFSIPVSLRDYRFFMVGANLRLGPLTVGTQNLASYLGLGKVNGMDLFVSLKFNFNKGSCDDDKFDACWSADFGNKKKQRR